MRSGHPVAGAAGACYYPGGTVPGNGARQTPMKADLHMHSLHSDGELTPAEVVRLAHRRKVELLALTDHDTLDGFAEASATGAQLGIRVLAAAELTVGHEGHEYHLLAYFPGAPPAGFAAMVKTNYGHRERRYWNLRAQLAAQGLLPAQPANEAPRYPGRPDLAAELVRMGKARNVFDAFRTYLNHGTRVVLPQPALGLAEAAGAVRDLGGAPVLAHPGTRVTETGFAHLRAKGLAGIECHHPMHENNVANRLRRTALTLKMLATGGSDFHGPTASAGIEPGGRFVPADVGPEMLRYLEARA